MTAPFRRPAVILLSACVLGLATAPLPLLVLGGRSEWGGTFGLVASAVALLASGALVFRYLIRPADMAGTGASGRVVETASWVAIVAFLILGSGINLLVGVARAGVVADSFLLLTLLALPIIILRRTAIEARIAQLPRAGVTITVMAVLVAAGIVALIDLATPARFPGGHKSRHADDPVGSLPSNAQNAIAGVTAVLRNLPAGKYTLGLPRPGGDGGPPGRSSGRERLAEAWRVPRIGERGLGRVARFASRRRGRCLGVPVPVVAPARSCSS